VESPFRQILIIVFGVAMGVGGGYKTGTFRQKNKTRTLAGKKKEPKPFPIPYVVSYILNLN
jgi:hypothetical protein